MGLNINQKEDPSNQLHILTTRLEPKTTTNLNTREDFQLEIKSSNPEVIFVNPNNDLKAMSPGSSTLSFK